MRKKYITAGILALCAVLGANAKVLSPDEAFARAMDDKPLKAFASSSSQPKVAYTEMAGDEAAAYVIGNDYGFCVVGADDASVALLGYSDTKFDAGDMPDNLRYWLGEYGRQIAWARANGISGEPAKRPAETRQAISPILTTTWDQGWPYNSECPEWQPGTNCITGCVATAMAQVMKSHNWPDVGEGGSTYYPPHLSGKLTMRYYQTEFDWDNMLDHYRNGYTDEQRKAVAILNRACGISVEMDYTSGACGAQSSMVARALPKYFKYDKGIRYLLRNFWNLQEWEDLIYDELKEGRVVYYSGSNSSAGHAFVCDGYDKNGYFHINWGWNGASNGYFLLWGLDPSQQGLGGSDAGYNGWQEIITNIKPRGEEESPAYNWVGGYDFYIADKEYTLGDAADMTDCWFYNYSLYTIPEVAFGLKFTPKNGGEPIVSISTEYIKVASFYGFGGSPIIPSDLSDGEYTVVPVWGTPDGTVEECRVAIYANQSYTMTVANGKATFAKDYNSTVGIEDFNHNRVYVGGTFHATAKLVNNANTDFYKHIKASVRTLAGKEVMWGDAVLVDVMAGSFENIEYLSELHSDENTEFDTSAKHILCFTDENGNVVTEGEEIDIYPVTATVLKFDTPYMVNGDVAAVDPKNVKVGTKVKCADGFYGNKVSLKLFTARGTTSFATSNSSVIYLDIDDEQVVELTSRIPDNMIAAKNFRARFEATNGDKSEFLKFTVDESGIAEVAADAPVSVEYYNLQGMRIDDRMAKGTIAIVVTTFADGTQVKETVYLK